MAYKIAFYDTKPYDERSFTEANEKFGFDIKFYKGHLNMNNVVLTKGADVVCIFVNDTADAEVIRAMADNGVKLLALRCAGYNNVDLTATVGRMKVVRVPAYSPYAVAEFTVALMLSLNRKIPRATMRTRDGNFSLHGLMGFDMHGKTAGIIGTGKIAKILIQILRGFGMNILAYDLYPDYNFAREHQVVYCSLEELYHSSDIISLHCPLTEQTKYLINDYSISKMKDGVMIINTGRGRLIHTNALIEGLKDGTIDMIATDHAPHTPEEKACFETAPNGSIGMETSLAASLTALDGILTLSQIVEKMSWNPAKILGIPAGTLKLGADADVVLFDPTLEWVVNENALHGKSRNTPFKGMHLKGKVIATFLQGRKVFDARRQ